MDNNGNRGALKRLTNLKIQWLMCAMCDWYLPSNNCERLLHHWHQRLSNNLQSLLPLILMWTIQYRDLCHPPSAHSAQPDLLQRFADSSPDHFVQLHIRSYIWHLSNVTSATLCSIYKTLKFNSLIMLARGRFPRGRWCFSSVCVSPCVNNVSLENPDLGISYADLDLSDWSSLKMKVSELNSREKQGK